MNVFNAGLVIFFTLCFAVLIFFLGLWVGKLVALDKKEKKRCGYCSFQQSFLVDWRAAERYLLLDKPNQCFCRPNYAADYEH